jgi:hypothetical protein
MKMEGRSTAVLQSEGHVTIGTSEREGVPTTFPLPSNVTDAMPYDGLISSW